jgi:hypothetical protein
LVLTLVVMKSSDLWVVMLCSLLKVIGHIRQTCRLDVLTACFMLVSFLAYFLALKMKVTYSSKTSVDFQQTSQPCIPEDRTLQRSDSYHSRIYKVDS